MYYLKCLLKSESSPDYRDGLLSMKHIPNVVVIDMTHIIAKYALISRKEDLQKYGYNEKGILFELCSGRVVDPEEQENVKNAKENNLELPFPWILRNRKLSDNNGYQSHLPITNSDVHLCLFDRFHENNTSSEIESLRKIGCVLEFKGMLLNGFQTLKSIYHNAIAHLVIRFLSCILILFLIWFLTSYLWNYVLLMRKCT